MKLGQAQGLLDHGYDLFPIRHDKKIPLYRGWREAPALTAPQAIKYARLGVRMRADQLVIDVDRHEGRPHGDPRGLRLPPAPTVTTAGGGLHIYFKLPPDHGKIRHILPEFPGIEFKTLGRFVVAPCQEGYDWDDLGCPDLPAPMLPDHVLSLIIVPPVGVDDVIGMATVEWQPAELAAALDQLDPTEYREHDKWFSLMAACHEATGGAGLEEFTRWSVADGMYAGHEGRIAGRWASLVPGRAGNAGMGTLLRELGGERPASAAAREAVGDFDSMPVDTTSSAVDNPLAVRPDSAMQEMDRAFKAVDENGKLRIYAKRRDNTLNRNYWVRYAKKDFLEVCKNVKQFPMMMCGASGKPKAEDPAAHWLDHYRRKKTYQGITFAPEHHGDLTPDGQLNLWQGFAVEERRGSWEYLKELVFEMFCDRDTGHYDYVMNWLARAVQMPWEPGAVALVFKGKKGVGKSTLGSYFCRLYGHHGLQITSPLLLTGRFNSHMRDCVALFADEAFWAGDKAGEGVLKGLVTEKMLTYEGKGTNAEGGRNCVHLIMASNENWVVPASIEDERRFAVFEVLRDDRARDWWDRLHHEMNNGGLAAMLWELKNRDISRYDVRAVPQTVALAAQKLQSLDPSTQWLVDLVMNDYSDLTMYLDNTVALMEDLEASIDGFFRRKRFRPSINSVRVHLGMLIMRLLPVATKVRVNLNDKRQWGYRMPSSEVAKEHVLRALGMSEVASEEIVLGSDRPVSKASDDFSDQI